MIVLSKIKKHKNQTFNGDKILCDSKDILIYDSTFTSEEDILCLKNSENVKMYNVTFTSKMPLWHCVDIELHNGSFDLLKSRPLWHCESVLLRYAEFYANKSIRHSSTIRCQNITVDHANEFSWKNDHITINDSVIIGDTPIYECSNVKLSNTKITGDTALNYVNTADIRRCQIDSNNSLWYSEDVTISGSKLNGDYIGWYSKNLTIKDSVINSTHSFYSCENLKIENCIFKTSDSLFEDSTITVHVISPLESIINPKSGIITAKSIGKAILNSEVKDNVEINVENQ